jgi:hypothetical protein
MLYKYEVGELYKEGVTSYPNDGCVFDFTKTGCILTIFMKSPNETEINDIRTGAVKAAIFTYENVIMLLFKFGSQPWYDAPFTVHKTSPGTFSSEEKEFEPGVGFSLMVILVDGDTGRIAVLRLIGATTAFSNELIRAAKEQLAMPAENFDSLLSQIMAACDSNKLHSFVKTTHIIARSN